VDGAVYTPAEFAAYYGETAQGACEAGEGAENSLRQLRSRTKINGEPAVRISTDCWGSDPPQQQHGAWRHTPHPQDTGTCATRTTW